MVHDPTGRFLLRPVNPGSYELRATTVNGNSATLAVTVAPGEKKEGLRVVLQLGGRVVAKVVDRENDQPLAGVEIEWLLRGRPGTSITMTVQTPGQAPRTVTFNRTGGTQPAGGATASATTRPAAPAPTPPAPSPAGR